ncbi:MAG: molecular chaperone TorD family protein [Anaerolineales bacterium]|jgi:TorA maturation chaperone TorD
MNLERNNQNSLEWTSTLLAEQLVLGLLGKILFEFPDKDLYQSLVNEVVFEEIPLAAEQPDVQTGMALLKKWNKSNQDSFSNENFEAIREDYTRLFIGPGKVLAPPWESFYFHEARVIFQEQTLQVREWFRRYGLESIKIHNEPDDHIGLELAFSAHLAGIGLVAIEERDQTRFKQVLDAQKQFLSEHPLRWVAEWSKQVEIHSQTDFFRGIALIAKGVLTELASILNDMKT